MTILITNDDGIDAMGLKVLTEMAKTMGDVYVLAPARQCSGKSRSITTNGTLHITPVNIAENVISYSVDGAPADCVRVAINYIMPVKPDLILSGINEGYNVGGNIVYSGTIGAALEGVAFGIPAIAYSMPANTDFKLVNKYLKTITEQIIADSDSNACLTNINFPNCSADDCKGVLWERQVDSIGLYKDYCEQRVLADGSTELRISAVMDCKGNKGTDIEALLNNYISVGKI